MCAPCVLWKSKCVFCLLVISCLFYRSYLFCSFLLSSNLLSLKLFATCWETFFYSWGVLKACRLVKNEAELDYVCCCCVIFVFKFSCAARPVFADWRLDSMARPASSRVACFGFFCPWCWNIYRFNLSKQYYTALNSCSRIEYEHMVLLFNHD